MMPCQVPLLFLYLALNGKRNEYLFHSDSFLLTGFHKQFTHATNNRKPDKEEMIIIMAALYSPSRSRSPLVEWS